MASNKPSAANDVAAASPDLTILDHPIPKMSDTAGKLHVYGDPSSKHLIIMSAGFPDSQQAMTPMARRLATSGDCLVGITCPPGYDDTLDWRRDCPKEGFSLDDWVANFRDAVKALRKYSSKSIAETTLTAIVHDWGAIMGTMYCNYAQETDPDGTLGLRLDRLVIYDVLTPPHPDTDRRPQGHEQQQWWQPFCIMTYQLIFAAWFLMNRYLPFPYLTWLFCFVTNGLLSFFQIYPLGQRDRENFQDRLKTKTLDNMQREWYKAYAYYHYWKDIFQGKLQELVMRMVLPQDLSKVPVLYLYGASKPYEMDEPNAIAMLNREEAEGRPSRVVRVENAGHFLYMQQPDICYSAMEKFFEATVPS